MQKLFLNYAFMGICTIGVTGLYSCVDNAYDLNKEIDKTITMGGNLTLPSSSTEEMFLKDILDLGDDSSVRTDENGNYSIVQEGNPSNSEVNVSEVNIDTNNGFGGFNKEVSFSQRNKAKIEGSMDDINITENNINDDIVDLKSATIKKQTSYLKFSIATKTYNNITEGTFTINQGFTINFPDYMVIEDASGFCTVNNDNVLKFNCDKEFTNGTLDIGFIIKEIKFADNSNANFDFKSHTITLKDKISLNGYISSTNANGNYTFSASVDCRNIEIKSAEAIVNPEITINIDPIEINNLPDFLTEEGVVFDATDPRIFLTVSNDSPLDAKVSMTLVSEKAGIEKGRANVTGIRIPGNSDNRVICIHQNRDMEISGIDNVYCDNLSDIIKYIPDMIRIQDIVAQVPQNEYYNIQLGTEFNIKNTYKINTPLMFGTETNIEYTENIDGFSEDLEDAEFSQLELSMKAINKIPMNLVLSAEATDKNGNAIDNVTIDTAGNIEASNGTEATEKEISFIIKTNDGSTIKNFDGLKLKVTGTATEATKNVSLNENQSLKLDNLKLKVVGGITMDLN